MSNDLFAREDFNRYLDQRQRMAQEARENIKQPDIDYQGRSAPARSLAAQPLSARWAKCGNSMNKTCRSLHMGRGFSASSPAVRFQITFVF
jgi:hypothetical protein